MRRQCRERFPRDRLQKKPLVSDPGMYHGTSVMHTPWWMSGSLTRGAKMPIAHRTNSELIWDVPYHTLQIYNKNYPLVLPLVLLWFDLAIVDFTHILQGSLLAPGPTFIKPDQRNPWIKDQLWNDLLSTILHLQLPNFVSCGRDKPSHMTQNLVTVGVKL